MPVSTAPYTRKYAHTKSRGAEESVACDYCHKQTPRWKTFMITKGFRISDPAILQQVDRRYIHMMRHKYRVCVSCARFRGIVQPGKSVRKKHMEGRQFRPMLRG